MTTGSSTRRTTKCTVLVVSSLMIAVAFVSWSVMQIRRSSASGGTSAVSSTDDEFTQILPGVFRRMLDVDGAIQRPGADRRTSAVVYLFLATECPISNGLLPELARLHATFSSLSVEFYGVIADRFTSPAEASRHRREFAVPFPVLLDTSGTLQRKLQPTHAPQAVVVGRDGRVLYSGRIDDRYSEPGRPKATATRTDLQDALLAITAGQAPLVTQTEPVGCRLEPLDDVVISDEVTFCREIAPLVFTQCTRCHRTGEATPFPLESFEQVRRRAHQIAEVVADRTMPPWKPASGFGHFFNEQRLTDDEIALIQSWVDNGAPPGDEADLPPRPQFADGWQLGEPDLILEVPVAFDVPADGPDIYQHFVLPTGLTERGLVTAFEFRPGDASVVHHAWLYFDATGTARQLDAATPEPGYVRFGGPGFVPSGNLGGWGPGGLPRTLPPGMARSVPAESDLVLQVHYHPTGKPARDRSRVGLYFAREPVEQLVAQIMVADVNLEIPAGAKRHRFEASYTVPVETILFDASPHMHLLGREVEVTATTPDGTTLPLIRIDDWNFFWQDHYVYETPVRLSAGTRIDLVAWYDNSSGNPLNPHSPPQTVRFGEASDDEMGICYFQATSPEYVDYLTLTRHATRYFEEMAARLEQQRPVSTPAELTNSIGMEFCRIPAGEVVAGSQNSTHRVRVTGPYWLARHEVTVGMFRRFVAATGYRTEAEQDDRGCNGLVLATGEVGRRPEWIWSSPGFDQTDDHPVVCVSWNDAVAFCRWLSDTEGHEYRLPTEVEWEYACRAGTQSRFSTGESAASLRGYANTGDQSLKQQFPVAVNNAPWRDGFAFTAPVGSFRSNGFGLYDMHGNVGEWCSDWFDPTDAGGTRWRVVRGGSWYNSPLSCRSSGRHDGIPTARSTTNGFRVVRSVPGR